MDSDGNPLYPNILPPRSTYPINIMKKNVYEIVIIEHQHNAANCASYHVRPMLKMSRKSVHTPFCNTADRQWTSRQTNGGDNKTFAVGWGHKNQQVTRPIAGV